MIPESERYVCDILSDMRDAYKTRNFSYLPGLIEELQYRANRMEDALEIYGGWESIPKLLNQKHEIKKEIDQLKEERTKLQAGPQG